MLERRVAWRLKNQVPPDNWKIAVGNESGVTINELNNGNTIEIDPMIGPAGYSLIEATPMPLVPKIVTHSTGASGPSNTTNHNISLPSGINIGNIIIVAFSTTSTPELNIDAAVSGEKWNRLGSKVSSSSLATLTIFWKIAEGGDALTLSTSAARQSTHICLLLENGTTVSGSSDSNNGPDTDPPEHFPAGGAAERLWFVVRLATQSAGMTQLASAAPPGFSNLLSSLPANAAPTTEVAHASSSAASLDPSPFSSPTTNCAVFTIAVGA